MKKRAIAIIISTMMTLSISVPTFAAESGSKYGIKDANLVSTKASMNLLNNEISKAIIEQGVKSEKSSQEVELLIVTDAKDITGAVSALNGRANRLSDSVFVVTIPANKAGGIANIDGVKAVGRDRILSLPKPINLKQIYVNGRIAEPDLEYSHERTGVTKFWKTGYDGRGTKVAIIDTGVEPNNEMLTLTTEGKLKITDYQDFWKYTGENSEGDVKLTELSVSVEGLKKFVSFNNNKIYVPADSSSKLLIGQFKEKNLVMEGGKTIHDVNNNGRTNDEIAVLVKNYSNGDKSDDVIYVDTNFNNDLSDDKPMGIYKEVAKNLKDSQIFVMNGAKAVLENGRPKVKPEYKDAYARLVNNFYNFQLGLNPTGTSFNFVITNVEMSNGSWLVNLGYDGNGHGSHVAGDAAGNGYVGLPFVDKSLTDDAGNVISPDGTLQGSAPGAQIMACRVFQSSGGTPESAYLMAMEYACKEGYDVINMSIGSLPDINDGLDPSSVLVDQLSKKYGTIFCISAGNDGPSTNATGTPGVSEWAFTVGAYNPGWINYGNKNTEDGLWYFSSRGPTEDGRLKPTIIAPGSMISAAPMWSSNDIRKKEVGGGTYAGYALEQGTSMSSPYTAGVVATIKQAIKENNIPYHPLVVKEALFQTGVKTKLDSQQYLPCEIGGGMVNPVEALNYLKNLKTRGLSQQYLMDSSNEYIDRSRIVPKTEFDYTEKLSYKPEGLYVRSGDIPSTVKVKITNTTDSDLMLNLTKDSYEYQNDWLSLGASSIDLKKGEAKELALVIDRAKLNPGINSVLINMNDPNTLLNEGAIPVTVINYMDLSASNSVVTENETRTFGPGGVDKHFIRIPYGTQRAEVTLHLTDPSDTTNILPFVTAPSGIQESNVPGLDWIYPTNDTRTLVLNNPEPGTWEFDMFSGLLTAAEIPNAKGRHTITAKLKGVTFGPAEIKYSGRSGEYKEQDITLNILNATSNDSQTVTIKKTNLAGENTNKKTERMEVRNGEENIVKFTVPENNPNIFVSAAIKNTEGASDDLDMELHRISYDSAGNLILGATIAMSANALSNEKIYMETLSAGEYAFVVSAFQTLPITHYDFTYQIANSSDGENDIVLRNTKLDLNRDLKQIKMGVRVPSKPGKYIGIIFAVDQDGNILGKAKVMTNSEGTDNNLVIKHDSIVRVTRDFDMTIDGEINESNNLNNIYGVQLSIKFNPSELSAKAIMSGEIFKNANVKEISKEVSEGRITYAVGFVNASKDVNAMGAIAGNIAKIKMNAKAIGNISISIDKLLVVNHRGDEIALNVIFDNTINVVDPHIAGSTGSVNILDICKMASRVGETASDSEYNANLDLNKDGAIDFKDLDFIIKCFNEDN